MSSNHNTNDLLGSLRVSTIFSAPLESLQSCIVEGAMPVSRRSGISRNHTLMRLAMTLMSAHFLNFARSSRSLTFLHSFWSGASRKMPSDWSPLFSKRYFFIWMRTRGMRDTYPSTLRHSTLSGPNANCLARFSSQPLGSPVYRRVSGSNLTCTLCSTRRTSCSPSSSPRFAEISLGLVVLCLDLLCWGGRISSAPILKASRSLSHSFSRLSFFLV
mmetsp:Transcript_7255/g.13930  ORF Transcript_7255/g.13930 Transcript_7255/m.13930 type:complete len:216 (-) Transcript_7255:584-1231(-)